MRAVEETSKHDSPLSAAIEMLTIAQLEGKTLNNVARGSRISMGGS